MIKIQENKNRVYYQAITKTNLYIVLILIILVLFDIAIHGSFPIIINVFLGSLIFLLLSEVLINSLDYFNHKIIFHAYKLVLFFVLATIMILCTDNFELFSTMFCIYIYESYILVQASEVDELFYRISLLAECETPLMTLSAVRYILFSNSDFDIFILLIFCAFYTYIFEAILSDMGKTYKSINEKLYNYQRIVMNSQEEYNKLKTYQERLVKANSRLGIQKVQLEAANTKITRNSKEMQIQQLILKKISKSLDPVELSEFVVDSISENLSIDLCFVLLKIDNLETKSNYSYKINTHKDGFFKAQIEKYINSGFFEQFFDISFNEYYQYADNRVDDSSPKYSFLKGSNIGSLLMQQILIDDEIVGILVFAKNSYDYFKDNQSFFNSIAEQCSISFNNAYLYTKAEKLATIDELTGLYNRRYLNIEFESIIQSCINEKINCAVILFDIDKFKNINDTYGHIFGDEVIRFCGHSLIIISDKYDGFASRYGGEEFVIIFKDINIEKAELIAKEIHETVKSHEFSYEGNALHIDISIGVTCFPDTCEEPLNLLNRADWAMYASKRNGRGRITIDRKDLSLVVE